MYKTGQGLCSLLDTERIMGGKMRDIKRIPRICKLLEKKWKKVPDERLGQFLANEVFGHHKDIFFQEDDVTEKILGVKK